MATKRRKSNWVGLSEAERKARIEKMHSPSARKKRGAAIRAAIARKKNQMPVVVTDADGKERKVTSEFSLNGIPDMRPVARSVGRPKREEAEITHKEAVDLIGELILSVTQAMMSRRKR